ncbi:ubiquitin-protein ligase E3A-like isoform X2 [Mercenaria mercenaria]|uniref:ubiquitin-protein ligase E3A-like isoform X2 n=1 Tax=Mercenaria mercenaria TaxID=6596 RepID=UPI00234E4B43|nr:ubiquitin-protein ligase E3A-like isoform X2 [Mercenaria mercenaria]
MNNKASSLSESGKDGASGQDSRGATPGSDFPGGMKRAAAKQLIEAYYFQLTDGCGNHSCTNKICASSPSFNLRDKDRNALALKSIELFKKKAQLCENQRNKIARLPVSGDSSPVGATGTSPLTSPRLDIETLPGPSKGGFSSFKPGSVPPEPPSSSKCTGAISRSTPTTPTQPKELPFLNEERLLEILRTCQESNDWSSLIKIIGSVYSSPESLIKSFQIEAEQKLSKEKVSSYDADKDIDDEDLESGEKIHDKVSERKCLHQTTGSDVNVDLNSLRRCYALLMEIPDLPFQNALINALRSLSKTLDMDFRYTKQVENEANYLNIFVIVLEIPLLHSPEFIEVAYPDFCKAMGQLPLKGQVKLVQYWSGFEAEKLKDMVLSLQQMITVKLIDGESRWNQGWSLNNEDAITGPIRVMKILYYASMYGGDKDSKAVLEEERRTVEGESQLQNEFLGASAMGHDFKEPRQIKDDPLGKELDITHADCRHPLVDYEEFVNETLNENISVETDYKFKLESEESPNKFSFANYSFVLNTASKQASLYMDNRIQMFRERRSSIIQTLVHGMPPMPFLRIRVSRERLIDDALVALEMVAMENPSDLRKQLFVEFDGEQGLDEGGVSKEFFQLIVEEIFNIDFGMFTYNSETRQFWFNSMSFENDAQFTLIGIVLGLAIYNSTIVDVHFPSVVYRKLVGKKGTFQDLADVDPYLAKSLREILDYEGDDFEDAFMQTFQISYKDVFGSTITHELKDKGDDIPVTQLNKKELGDNGNGIQLAHCKLAFIPILTCSD